MVKKFFCILTVFIFALAFTMNTPLLAQEEEKVEDVMDISLEDLLDVEITTAGKKAEKIGEVPASVVVITREDIERYGYQSLEEVIENVAGFYKLNDMSYYGTSYGVRGFWSTAQRNIVFMVNGVHQFDGYWKTSFLENFSMPIEAIDRIEVVRGPMSVIYGSGAFFGAINIFTNQPAEDGDLNIVSVSAGSENKIRAGAKMSGSSGDFNYAFSAGYFDTAGPNEPLSMMATYEPDWAGITSANNTTEDRLEESNKYFNLAVDYKGFYAKMSFSESIKENYIVIPSVSDGTTTTANFTTVAFGYKKDLSDKFNLDASVAYHKHNWWGDFDLFDPSFYSYEFGKSEEIEGDLTMIFSPSDKFNLTTGLHYSSIFHINWFDIIPAFEYNVNYLLPGSIDTRSLFMQMDFYLSDWLRLVAGARVEQLAKYDLEAVLFYSLGLVPDAEFVGIYDNDDPQFIPRVAAILTLNDKNYMKFLYGKAIRHAEYQPNLENLLIGRDILNPEYINTFEFNYISSPSPNITFNLSLFYNSLKNLVVRTIGFDPDGSIITYYSNGGDLETYGGELSILTRPVKNFIMELSGTYQKTKDKRTGYEDIDVAYSPKLLGHFKIAYDSKWFALSVLGRYVDEMYPLWDPESNARIGESVDSYFVVDGNLRIKDLFGEGFFLNIRVNNIMDTEYIYPTNINNNLWADKGVIGRGLGRTFLVTIGKKFMPMP